MALLVDEMKISTNGKSFDPFAHRDVSDNNFDFYSF